MDQSTPMETDWSMIRSAMNGDGSESQEADDAMEELARRYWPAVYAYVRSSGCDVHLAADLTQGYLCDVVLKRKLFQQADPKRGRFRSLLVSSLQNYLRRAHREASGKAGKAGGAERAIDPSLLDRAHAAEEGAEVGWSFGDLPPETAFGVQWAAILIRDVMHEVREKCLNDGLEPHWTIFEHRVIRPIMFGGEPTPYHILVTRMDLSDTAQAMNMLVTIKRRFARALYTAVSRTVDDPLKVDGELRSLIQDLERQS